MKKLLIVLSLALSMNVYASLVDGAHGDDCASCHADGKSVSANMKHENEQCKGCHGDMKSLDGDNHAKHVGHAECTDCHKPHKADKAADAKKQCKTCHKDGRQ